MRFVDIQTVENTVTKLVPVLFENYEDGMGDFAYLGGDQGRAKLESALAQPRQTFGGEYLYPTLAEKTAAVLWSIIKNHPFVDGNKRAALTTANLFLLMNATVLLATQQEAVGLCRSVAGYGAAIEFSEVAQWLSDRIVNLLDSDTGDRMHDFVMATYSENPDDAIARLNFLNAAIERMTELSA